MIQVTFFQPLRKDNERAKPNALYHVQVLNKSVKWHLSVFVLYPLGSSGAECQRSSQESHKVHLVETGVQLCFDVLWLPQKRNLQFPVLTNTRSGFYLAEVWFKRSSDSCKGAISSWGPESSKSNVLFVAFAHRAFGANESLVSCCPVVTDASLSQV